MNELAPVRKEELTERDVTARYRAVLQQIEDGPISAENAAANENMLAALEEMARRSGLVSETAQVELWLTRFLNRWRLGEALRKAMRGAGPGRGKKGVSIDTSFRKLLGDLGIKNPTEANNVQRLACMPWKNALAYRDEARERPDMRTFAAALAYARRWWSKERRQHKIKEIGEAAAFERRYPIILADPPWRYENPPIGASNRSIENHYPTMTLEEICALRVACLPCAEFEKFCASREHQSRINRSALRTASFSRTDRGPPRSACALRRRATACGCSIGIRRRARGCSESA